MLIFARAILAAPARINMSRPIYWVLVVIVAVILGIIERVTGIGPWRRRNRW
jgi:hypothetical protein